MVALRSLLQTSALFLSLGIFLTHASEAAPVSGRRPLVIPDSMRALSSVSTQATQTSDAAPTPVAPEAAPAPAASEPKQLPTDIPLPSSAYPLAKESETAQTSATAVAELVAQGVIKPYEAPKTAEASAPATKTTTPTSEETVKPPESQPAAEASAPATKTETPPETEKAVSLKDLTLEKVVDLALKNSPEHDISQAQIRQATSEVEAAKAPYFPQVSVNGEIGKEYNFPFALRQGATFYGGHNYGKSASFNVRQSIFDGNITRETVKVRLQLVESANLSREKVNEQLIKFAVEVYMELRQYQQIIAASKSNLEALKDIQNLIGLREEAGDASNVEKNYILARVASAEKQYLDAQSALEDAFSALTFLIGEVPAFEASLPDLKSYEMTDSEAILQKALSSSTEMRIVQSDKKAANYDVQAAKGKYYPTVDFVVEGNTSDDLGGQTGIRRAGTAKVQINYKILDGGLRRATENTQMEKIKEIEAREKRIIRQIKQDVNKAFNLRQTTVKEYDITEMEIKANTDLEKLYREQFKHGDINIIQLVESQERIFSAQMRKFKLESDLVNVTFDLLQKTSDLLPKFCERTAC